MRHILFFILLFVGCPNSWSATQHSNVIQRLENSLEHKADYVKAKETRIADIRQQLADVSNTLSLYQLYHQLYDEYKSYKYDSAHLYAQKSLETAIALRKKDYIIEAKCAVAFCLSSAGLYKEAFETLESIDIKEASTDYRKKFFWMASRLNYDMADFNHSMPYQKKYVTQGGIYTDSLLRYLTPQSSDWLYAVAMRQMKEYHYDQSIETFKSLWKDSLLDPHIKAIVSSCLGWISISQKEREAAKDYLAQAAIYDNETATKETTALCVLAEMLYEDGDIERATRFVQESMNDANFYDARQRKIQIGNILPIIEQDRYNIIKNERNAITTALIVALLAVVCLLIATYIIWKQIKKLKEARKTIVDRNTELQLTNAQLSEANAIKNEYIGKTFYINAQYINKVEKLYKTLDRKIVTRQYENLQTSLKESELMADRKNMFNGFDETFLKLFPHFISEYNKLFDEKDQKMPDNEKSLTTEMRIFALMRLGITDSDSIASFLDYSVHTINTYKTRVKNKSIVDNDEFEQRIMAI